MQYKTILPLISFSGAMLVATGITASPALQSIVMAMVLLGALPVLFTEKPKLNLFALFLILYFAIHLLAFFNTFNKDGYWRDIRMKFPFLLMPIGFYYPNMLSQKRKGYILLAFITTVFIVGTITFCYYLFHLNYYNERIFHSKPVDIISFKEIFILIAGKTLPVDSGGNIIGLDHIYFSFMLAFSAWALFYLLRNGFFANRFARLAFILVDALMVIYIHTIAARTGLIAFYSAGFAVILYIIFVMKKAAVGIGIFATVAIIGGLSILFIPSLHNRFLNTKEDIGTYNNQKIIKNYSISPRIEALKTAFNIFKKSPLTGVSRGDIDTVMKQQYFAQKSSLEGESLILPHNQFVFELVASGLAGLAILILVFIYPVFIKQERLNLLFMLFLIICFFSFQAEYGLERQAGVSFFVLFYMLLSSWGIDLKTNHPQPTVNH